MNLESLMREIPQTVLEKEVRDWMKKNKANFSQMIRNDATGEDEPKWTLAEVAELAINQGLDPVSVRSVLGHWQDAVAGSRFERRVAMEEYKLDHARAEIAAMKANLEKDAGLRPQWRALHDYLFQGIDF